MLINERNVNKEEAEKLANELGCKYYEVSAKTGENILEALNDIVELTYHQNKKFKRFIKRKFNKYFCRFL